MSTAYETLGASLALNSLISSLSGGVMNIYAGTRPARGAAITNTLLCAVTMPDPFAASTSTNMLTANAFSLAATVAAGTPTWASLQTSANVEVMRVDVVSSGDGLVMATPPDGALTFPGNVQILSLTLTL